MDITASIEAILEARRNQLPKVAASLERLEQADRAIQDLKPAILALSREPKSTPEFKALVATLDLDKLREPLIRALTAQRHLHARFSRDTVNIGVSGQARVGKSTLLQALSGLSEEALPTGTGTPVTAVRSRIVCKPVPRARLTLHTWVSFRDEVIAPYHEELALRGLPETPDQFRNWPYPAASPDEDNSTAVLRNLVTKARDNLDRYLPYLTGKDLLIEDLHELHRWVAYPGSRRTDHARSVNTEPLYLAVRQALVECPFPRAEAARIGLIDLPGLGEIATRAEEHHVTGLREEVDYVLFVKRAVEGMAYWKAEDAKARALIDQARKPISRASDFVGIVSNEGGVHPDTLEVMLGDIRDRANAGLGEHPLKLYNCDAKDSASVTEQVLLPALAHLAERLPVMDTELLTAVGIEINQTSAALVRRLLLLRNEVLRSLPEAPGTLTRLLDLTGEMHRKLATDLGQVLRTLKAAARAGDDDKDFTRAIQATHAELARWARDGGLGSGKEKWVEDAVGHLARERTSAGLAAEELNRIRVHIGETYCRLDIHLRARIEELWERVGEVLGCASGTLLAGTQGRRSLEVLAGNLKDADETCPNLARALQDLLNLDVNYRSHFHPRVRGALDILDHSFIDPNTGEVRPTVNLREPTRAGAELMLRDLTDLAVQASHAVRQELLRDSSIMAKILYAAAEQFDDSFIRSGTSERELVKFCSAYRSDLFPGVFDDVAIQSHNVKVVKDALSQARESLEQVRG